MSIESNNMAIPVTFFRSSSYNCWSVCQQQYMLTYVLGKPSPSGKKAEMGTILHKVMECLAHGKKALQDNEKHFVDEVMGKVSISPEKLEDPQFVEWLFEKSFEYYTAPDKSIHEYSARDKGDVWEWSCQTLEYYDGMFDPRKRKIVEAEPHFDLPIMEPWAEYEYKMPDGSTLEGRLHVKGTIDLVTEIDPTFYEVIDWKSGKCVNWATGEDKHYHDFCADPQLSIYHWALTQMYPDVETFAMTINYVRTAGPFTLSYGPENIETTMKMLRKRFETIKHNVRPKLKSSSNKHWFCKYVCWFGSPKNPANQNCERTMCQHIADETRKHGIDNVIRNHTEPGFNVGFYQNPGS